MKPSSVAKLLRFFRSDTWHTGHYNDEKLLHDFIHDYVINHLEDGSDSEIREHIEKHAPQIDRVIIDFLIIEVLTSYHAILEFLKRYSPSKPQITYQY